MVDLVNAGSVMKWNKMHRSQEFMALCVQLIASLLFPLSWIFVSAISATTKIRHLDSCAREVLFCISLFLNPVFKNSISALQYILFILATSTMFCSLDYDGTWIFLRNVFLFFQAIKMLICKASNRFITAEIFQRERENWDNV